MLILMLIFLALLTLAYVVVLVSSHDYSVPKHALPSIGTAMAIFPHPDDEILTCGGLLYDLSRKGVETHLAFLTLGERGVEGAALTPALKPIRQAEARQSARVLKASKLHLYDLGDGQLDQQSPKIAALIRSLILTHKPNLLITYDQSGLYGHPDHIIVSRLVTDYVDHHSKLRLWYASRPQKVYNRMNLPVHMAKDKNFLRNRQVATHRISISIPGLIAKIQSMSAHRSQHFAFKKSRPWLPLWFFIAAQTDEYFHEVQ